MRALQAAVGLVLLLAGLALFVWSVDRSAWVLAAAALVAVGAVVLVDALVEVRTETLDDAIDALTAEQRARR